jgi:hypothetical protein
MLGVFGIMFGEVSKSYIDSVSREQITIGTIQRSRKADGRYLSYDSGATDREQKLEADD